MAVHISNVKALAESIATGDHGTQTIRPVQQEEESIPVIDVSLLTSSDPNQRRKVVQDLEKACRDWGIFMVINHGIEEKQMEEIIEFCAKFFDLKEEEKKEFKGEHAMDSITYGTSVHGAPIGDLFLWREFLKVKVHPQFYSPHKPLGFSMAMEEYCTAIRKATRSLLGGISESLGLEPSYLEKAINLDSSFQLFAANFYPPCPQPELAMGLPPHTDHGLLTFLICNGVDGLQFHRNGRWIDAKITPGAFIVNVADQIEILSNGKYKSCVHRAIVNNKATRISIAVPNGPSPHTVVGPLPELLVDNEIHPSAYTKMEYIEYVGLQFSKKLVDGTSEMFFRLKVREKIQHVIENTIDDELVKSKGDFVMRMLCRLEDSVHCDEATVVTVASSH